MGLGENLLECAGGEPFILESHEDHCVSHYGCGEPQLLDQCGESVIHTGAPGAVGNAPEASSA